MDWNELLDKETYSKAEIVAELSAMKLADLSSGEYVAKAKLDKAIESRKAAEAEVETLKSNMEGDEGLKARIAALETELDTAKKNLTDEHTSRLRVERVAKAEKLTGSDKLARLAVLDAEALVTEDVDFDEALEKVLSSDPDYTKPEIVTVSSGKETAGAPPTATSALMEALQAKLG